MSRRSAIRGIGVLIAYSIRMGQPGADEVVNRGSFFASESANAMSESERLIRPRVLPLDMDGTLTYFAPFSYFTAP